MIVVLMIVGKMTRWQFKSLEVQFVPNIALMAVYVYACVTQAGADVKLEHSWEIMPLNKDLETIFIHVVEARM